MCFKNSTELDLNQLLLMKPFVFAAGRQTRITPQYLIIIIILISNRSMTFVKFNTLNFYEWKDTPELQKVSALRQRLLNEELSNWVFVVWFWFLFTVHYFIQRSAALLSLNELRVKLEWGLRFIQTKLYFLFFTIRTKIDVPLVMNVKCLTLMCHYKHVNT